MHVSEAKLGNTVFVNVFAHCFPNVVLEIQADDTDVLVQDVLR